MEPDSYFSHFDFSPRTMLCPTVCPGSLVGGAWASDVNLIMGVRVEPCVLAMSVARASFEGRL